MAGLGGLSGPVDILPFNFCCSVCTLCLFGCASCFKRALVFVNSRRAEGGLPPCAGIEVENSQRVDWLLAFALKVR